MTKAQKEILRVLCAVKHPTAETVYTEVRKEIPTVAMGTIYRNLNIFAENNTIRRLTRSPLPDLFDDNPSPHEHMTCIHCGKTVDLLIPGLMEYISSHTTAEIVHAELSVQYICDECK
ncbi:MAG: transcriptional repressor [Defluviitaleaceae bacterium]|nr:transcriptional repressor [Defluviitaleaceae bacterium]